ncbi:MAG TPA: phosphatidylglycerol lysyltransferase domain-containing protein [Clostridiaceae bacterium]|nr:phosphatidylglycerol lysyltransferase domain-containing protein [Clostridiaceae bacterium]
MKFDFDEDALYIVKSRPEPVFLPPVLKEGGDLKKAYTKLLSHLKENDLPLKVRDASAKDVEVIRSLGYDIEVMEDVDNHEYIYLVEKLRNYSGKKLHGKRNHYNNFIKNYEYEIRDIEDSKEEAIALAKKWFSESSQSEGLRNELNGIIELLEKKEHFNIVGLSVFIDGVCQGFTILEVLNDEVILNHIEKADPTFTGLYAFLTKTALDTFGEGVHYTNREQDLGLPGLRRSKQSFYPEFLEEKFIVTFV